MLAAYRVWGLDAIARFNGMFAFALWDPARNRLVLARDRMGVKPLYIRRTGRSIVFASEIGALLVGRPADPADAWRPEPHLGAVHDFLARGKVDHSMATFVDGVTALQPGHGLVVEAGRRADDPVLGGSPQLADDARATVRGPDLHGTTRSSRSSARRSTPRSDCDCGPMSRSAPACRAGSIPRPS